MKTKFLSLIATVIVGLSALSCTAFADDLDNLGTTLPDAATTTSSVTSSVPEASTPVVEDESDPVGTAGSISDAYGQLGMSSEDIEKAAETVAPVVAFVNYAIGVVVAILGTILLAVTVIDLVYIISPQFIRNIGSNGAQQAPQGGMMGGMGGMMGAQQAQQPQATGFAALISDDCRAALAECGTAAATPGAAPMGGGGFGGGMGGGFGGGFGGGYGGGFGGGGMMGGMGAQQAPAAPKTKTVALCYLKKRVFSLVIIGVCIVVLTCTCFLDVGMKVGTWILEMVTGVT